MWVMAETKPYFLRDRDVGEALELLLVSAIVTILAIRAFLAATGYPQLGGAGLHIAHMLWGGLFMLAALVLLFLYWNPSMRLFAAVLAGVGFGTFIDELGKFITSDNDYFYQPTIALLYILFILLFLLARTIHRRMSLSPDEVVFNEEIRRYCERSDAALDTRIAAYFKFREWLNGQYKRLARNRWFALVVILGFVSLGLGELIAVATFLLTGGARDPNVPLIQAAASVTSACLIWIGIWRLRNSRIAAYAWFNRSVLVNIYVTQVFIFYSSQLAAIGGLFINILIYVALRYMASQESEEARVLT